MLRLALFEGGSRVTLSEIGVSPVTEGRRDWTYS
jgi:hypothetical protein